MGNAILIAQLLSPMYLLVGISIIFNQEFYKKMFLEIAQSKLISYMSGILKFV